MYMSAKKVDKNVLNSRWEKKMEDWWENGSEIMIIASQL